MPTRLRDGIDAAKRGDKQTARRLLTQVLSVDGNNEIALMWMASVVEDLKERRFYLEKVLQINPNNARARAALKLLGVTPPEPSGARPQGAAGDFMRDTPSRGGTSNVYLIAAAVVGIVVVAVIVAALVSSLRGTSAPTATPDVEATFAVLLNPTQTVTPDRRPPTETVLPGVVVTLDPNLLTPLPPTFTPTPTQEPSETPIPTETPFPLNTFAIIYSDFEPNAAQPSLYRGNADGSGEVKLQSGDVGGFSDVAVTSDAQRIAFIRTITVGDGQELPQLFVASVDQLPSATQLTSSSGTLLAHPNWSPDGTQIVYSSSEDGDEEIWVINADGGDPIQLTTNDTRDFDPEFSPDGRSIIFASEADSPGFSKIYTMNANGSGAQRLNDMPGSFAPTWSPDGSRVAFVSTSGGDGDIYMMDADGQRVFLLTVDDNGAEDRAPKWSPDSRWIAFASNREGEQFRWYAVNLDGTIQPVTVNDRSPQSLSFVTG